MREKNEGMNGYLTPLIERETFFGNPKITSSSLSPDGRFISFIKAYKGVMNIWIKTIDAPFDDAFPLTMENERPIRSYFWTWDSRYIIYAQDKAGDENFSLYRIDPEKASSDNIPEAFVLTPEEDTTSFVMSLPKSKPGKIYIGLNARDKSWHDFLELDIASGAKSMILENTEKLNGGHFDLEGNLRFVSRSLNDGGNEILKWEADGTMTQIFRSGLEETISPLKFRKDGKAYFISNLGKTDLVGLYLYDPMDNSLKLVESDPDQQVDLHNASFSAKTHELIATIYIGDKKRIYWKSDYFQKHYQILQDKFPGAEIAIGSTTRDEETWIVSVYSDTDPGTTYLYDTIEEKEKFLYQPRPELSKEKLAEMQPVHFNSLDGLDIPAYLTLPIVEQKKNLPAILLVHGGPWARDYWGYNSYAQFLANRGYAVMQVNFRGSTGFGKKFLNAAINEWGEKMQDDLTAAYHYLVNEGIADSSRVAIMGGSYGGYATLAGLCFTPDIYAAGVSIVGPSNLFTLLETIPPYWESARVMFHKRMGDPGTPEGRKQLKRQSPFFHADKIKAPLLVAQGANDPRVKKSESDQIVIAMRNLGLPVEYLNFPDEGHGFARPENSMAFMAVTESFLARHLGGRFQEDIPVELNTIIENASVDVATLKMPDFLSKEQKQMALPDIQKLIKSHELKYGITLDLQGQELHFELLRNITVNQDKLEIQDTSTSHMHSMKDVTRLDANTFAAKSRQIEQGPMTIELALDNRRTVNGTLSVEGNEKPFEFTAEADFLLDGPMTDVYLSRLDFEEGLPDVLRVFQAQSQQLKYYRLEKEDGSTEIDGYSCTVLKVWPPDAPDEISRYFIKNGDSPVLVRKESIIREMNGARMTMSLIETRML